MATTNVGGGLREVVLASGLSAVEVDERVRRAARIADVGNRAVAFYLAELDERGLFQELGAPTVVAYATRALGISRRKARELVMAGLRLRELAAIDAAFAAGAVSWSKVRRLCAVATADTEAEWLACAQRCSQDELERAVRGARRGDRPRAGTGLPRARFRVAVDLDPLQQQLWENARAKLRAELGWDAEVQDADLLVEMARLVLASDADGCVPGRQPVDGSLYRIVVYDGPEDARVWTADGEEPLDEDLAELVTEDAAVSPKLRAKVLARDGHRCCHCGCRRNLHVHHVTWRRNGGKTTPANLVVLCAKCHGLVHEGLLEVDMAQGAGPPGVAQGAGLPGVAQGAGLDRIAFVFRDAHGARVDRWPLLGPRVRTTPMVAQGATSGDAAVLDGRWLKGHLHWFADGPRGLVVRREYRDAFEKLAARAAG